MVSSNFGNYFHILTNELQCVKILFYNRRTVLYKSSSKLSVKQGAYHERRLGSHRITNEKAILSLKESRGDFYDYSEVVFSGSKGYIKIKCPIHGKFEQRYDHHKNGSDCKACASIKRKEALTLSVTDFANRAKNIHDNRYKYYLSEKLTRRVKIRIYCKKCQKDFYQNPSAHLEGHGCRKCNRGEMIGFKRSRFIEIAESKGGLATLYIIKCFDSDEQFFKVGITTDSVGYRFKSNRMPYQYEVLKTVEGSGEYIWNLEKQYLKSNKDNHYKPLKTFGGSVKECFSEIPTI